MLGRSYKPKIKTQVKGKESQEKREKDWSITYSIAINYTTIHFESILLGWDGIDCWYWCPFVCCDMHRSPFTICSANWNALMEDSGFEGTVNQSDKPS